MEEKNRPERARPNDKPLGGGRSVDPRNRARRHPAFGLMKGMATIAPGVDLTEPAYPEWADLIDEKYGKEP
jgi:hypothetical protein